MIKEKSWIHKYVTARQSMQSGSTETWSMTDSGYLRLDNLSNTRSISRPWSWIASTCVLALSTILLLANAAKQHWNRSPHYETGFATDLSRRHPIPLLTGHYAYVFLRMQILQKKLLEQRKILLQGVYSLTRTVLFKSKGNPAEACGRARQRLQ